MDAVLQGGRGRVGCEVMAKAAGQNVARSATTMKEDQAEVEAEVETLRPQAASSSLRRHIVNQSATERAKEDDTAIFIFLALSGEHCVCIPFSRGYTRALDWVLVYSR